MEEQTPETVVPEVVQEPEKKPLMMQTVLIQLADGRQGIFAGPELIGKTEMLLKCIPRIVHVDFLPSREFGKAPELKQEAKPNVEQEKAPEGNTPEPGSTGSVANPA